MRGRTFAGAHAVEATNLHRACAIRAGRGRLHEHVAHCVVGRGGKQRHHERGEQPVCGPVASVEGEDAGEEKPLHGADGGGELNPVRCEGHRGADAGRYEL